MRLGGVVGAGRTVTQAISAAAKAPYGTGASQAANQGSRHAVRGYIQNVNSSLSVQQAAGLTGQMASRSGFVSLEASQRAGAFILVNYRRYAMVSGTAGYAWGEFSPVSDQPSPEMFFHPLSMPFAVGEALGGVDFNFGM